MKLSKILGGFNKAQAQLKVFIADTEAENKNIEAALKLNKRDVDQARVALSAINDIVGVK